ncbi:hypothetical protein AURDEDRAFT_113492 [Auricularia subglabra TFB-10046 SS5]|nr:hypothetical protein AURDEDRAFT_113492 [Auricularia subglabra TFB-10046 SS5]
MFPSVTAPSITGAASNGLWRFSLATTDGGNPPERRPSTLCIGNIGVGLFDAVVDRVFRPKGIIVLRRLD